MLVLARRIVVRMTAHLYVDTVWNGLIANVCRVLGMDFMFFELSESSCLREMALQAEYELNW